MKFGGFSEKSYGEAQIRSLKEQLVFNADKSVNNIKNELVIHFTGQRALHSPASVIDHYYRAISDYVTERNPKGLSLIKKFYLNQSSFKILVEEFVKNVYTGQKFDIDELIKKLRWHDVAVALLIIQVIKDGGLLNKLAHSLINECKEINPDFTLQYKVLLSR